MIQSVGVLSLGSALHDHPSPGDVRVPAPCSSALSLRQGVQGRLLNTPLHYMTLRPPLQVFGKLLVRRSLGKFCSRAPHASPSFPSKPPLTLPHLHPPVSLRPPHLIFQSRIFKYFQLNFDRPFSPAVLGIDVVKQIFRTTSRSIRAMFLFLDTFI